MKKALFTLFIIAALTVAFSVFVGAECVIDEANLSENGEIVADYIGTYTIDDKNVDVFSINVTYNSLDAGMKDGKIYYSTTIWNNGNRRQIRSTYLPSGFDLENVVYMFDKADVNGDGEFSATELIKGTEGGKNCYYTYESFENGVFEGLTDVKKSLTRLVYSRYLEYMGPGAYSEVSFVSVTYSGREMVEGTCFISPTLNSFHNGAMGGEANGSINRNEPQYSRLVFEERTGTVDFLQYAFCRGTLTEIVFMGGTYNLGSRDIIAFQYQKGTSTPSLQNIVIAEGAKINSGTISWNVGEYGIIYLGSQVSYEAQLENGDFSALTNKNDSFRLAQPCYVWGHEAEADDQNCTTAQKCIYAQYGCTHIFVEALEHEIGTVYAYENGFNKDGTKKIGCTNLGCSHGEITTILPLFTSKGYSRDENSSAIAFDYKANKDAIKEYEEYIGKKISYGVVASKALDIYAGSPINTDATAKDGAFSFAFEGIEYSLIQLKLTGIDKKDDALYCAGYFVIDGEVSYINGANIARHALAVSYNNYTGFSEKE